MKTIHDYCPDKDLLEVAKVAHYNMLEVTQGGGSRGGCGRVYVEFSGKPLRANSKIKKVLERAGFKMTKRPYYSGVRIYVGYDNATGKEFAMAEKVVEVFKNNNISCYVDGDSD